MTQFLKRPLVLMLLAGAATGLIAAGAALAFNTPGRAFGIGLAYFFGIFLGGWLTMGAVSLCGRVLMALYERQYRVVNQVMSDTESAFDRVDELMNAGGRRRTRSQRQQRKPPAETPAFLAAISRFLWKISAYAWSIGFLWTSSGLIILGLHIIGRLGNSPALYLLPIGGILLLATAAGTYMGAFFRQWQMLRRSRSMLQELLSIEQELAADVANMRG